jgi:hypothetical protein
MPGTHLRNEASYNKDIRVQNMKISYYLPGEFMWKAINPDLRNLPDRNISSYSPPPAIQEKYKQTMM